MPKYLTKEQACEKCEVEGMFYPLKDVEIDKIKSTLIIAQGDFESGKNLKKNLPKESSQWNSVLKLYYDSLHELADVFLRFERVKSDNHQCLFAYLCEHHPELELDWDFLEKIRTKRNGINYYSIPISQKDWKEMELQAELYISTLKKAVEKKINESKETFK
jgi:hypothetical protein